MGTVAEEIKIGKITYFPKELLGKGAEGRVYDGKLDNGRKVAVKRINFEFSDKDRAEKEINLLLKCDKHDNVVTYFAKELQNNEFLFIALERCDLSLKDWVEQNYKNFFISKTNILRQMTKGLEYLHRLNIIHRDLKPGNILMVKLTDEKFRIKISDFDISKELEDGQTSKTDVTGSGTRTWMPPEILKMRINSGADAKDKPKMVASPKSKHLSLILCNVDYY